MPVVRNGEGDATGDRTVAVGMLRSVYLSNIEVGTVGDRAAGRRTIGARQSLRDRLSVVVSCGEGGSAAGPVRPAVSGTMGAGTTIITSVQGTATTAGPGTITTAAMDNGDVIEGLSSGHFVTCGES